MGVLKFKQKKTHFWLAEKTVFFYYRIFCSKNIPEVLKHKNKNLEGGGELGGYTSSFDHDAWPAKILEQFVLAFKNYHPETLMAEEK